MAENLLCDIIEALSPYFDKLCNTGVNKKMTKITKGHYHIEGCLVLDVGS